MRKSERPDEETLRRYIAAGLPAKAIAERMGISRGIVYARKRAMKADRQAVPA